MRSNWFLYIACEDRWIRPLNEIHSTDYIKPLKFFFWFSLSLFSLSKQPSLYNHGLCYHISPPVCSFLLIWPTKNYYKNKMKGLQLACRVSLADWCRRGSKRHSCLYTVLSHLCSGRKWRRFFNRLTTWSSVPFSRLFHLFLRFFLLALACPSSLETWLV